MEGLRDPRSLMGKRIEPQTHLTVIPAFAGMTVGCVE
jgi:hypothetical protein